MPQFRYARYFGQKLCIFFYCGRGPRRLTSAACSPSRSRWLAPSLILECGKKAYMMSLWISVDLDKYCVGSMPAMDDAACLIFFGCSLSSICLFKKDDVGFLACNIFDRRNHPETSTTFSTIVITDHSHDCTHFRMILRTTCVLHRITTLAHMRRHAKLNRTCGTGLSAVGGEDGGSSSSYF